MWPGATYDDVAAAAQQIRVRGHRVTVDGIGPAGQLLVDDRIPGNRELGGAWDQTLASFAAAADLKPIIVHNAKPDAVILPN